MRILKITSLACIVGSVLSLSGYASQWVDHGGEKRPDIGGENASLRPYRYGNIPSFRSFSSRPDLWAPMPPIAPMAPGLYNSGYGMPAYRYEGGFLAPNGPAPQFNYNDVERLREGSSYGYYQ